MSTLKKCTKCTKNKPLESYTRDSTSKTGFRSQCKECRRQYRASKKKVLPKLTSEKVCNKCNKRLKLSSFYIKTSTFDGVSARCKSCTTVSKSTIYSSNPPATKKCTKCNKVKGCEDFTKDKYKPTGISSQCKECKCNSNTLRSYKNNKISTKTFIVCTRCNTSKRRSDYHRDSSSKIGRKTKCKECTSIDIKLKRDSCELSKLKDTLRSRTYNAFKLKNWKKSSSTQNLLGGTWPKVKSHIEKQFSEGMTWENHGKGDTKWHIDHITPLSSASNEIELRELCKYKNLQPLWQLDNLKKSDKLDWTPN